MAENGMRTIVIPSSRMREIKDASGVIEISDGW